MAVRFKFIFNFFHFTNDVFCNFTRRRIGKGSDWDDEFSIDTWYLADK